MLKIVPTVDFCGGSEYESQFARYYEIQNTEHYEYHPNFTDLVAAIDYIYEQGQTEITVDMSEWVFGPFYRKD
jgi:hypothetical protein